MINRVHKDFLAVVFGLLLGLTSTAQKYLGQTKSYILNDNQNCHIELNKSNDLVDVLIMECSGLTQVFTFNPSDNNLCDLWGNEFPVGWKGQMLSKILKGASFVRSGETLLPSACKSNLGTKYVQASIYERDGVLITVYDSDYCGLTTGEKFYVIVETYPHKN